ncbi:MAG TPA: protein kinase [Blastocatellia bacterium]|nr:protein kinase [Blastocatellia bacterium]
MTPERWKQVDQLLQDSLDREPAERAAFLAEACGGDDELRREVESLIGFHERAESFIETPPAEVAADWLAVKELRAGQTIGHYRLIRQIGRGGMGEVYLARDDRLERQVAIKLLPPRFTEDAGRVQRFRQEARAVSALNHPNIITIYEIGEAKTAVGALYFIATEFIEGRTLREMIRNSGMRPSEALEVVIQVASALSAAHAAGITHRDIKPENIMLRPDGYVKVLDFGLAKLNTMRIEDCGLQSGREDEETVPSNPQSATLNSHFQTNPGVVPGTVSYMSPEQARGIETDARSDIFSLGVVLYELITARRPFVGETLSDVIAALLGQEPPPLSEHDPDLPDELQPIVSRMLAKDRSERYQTADELRQALKSLKKDLAPEGEFSTREFSGLSLLAKRFTRRGVNKDYKTAAVAVVAAPATSSVSLIINRFLRSPMRVMLALAALAALVAGGILGRQWLVVRDTRIDSIAVLPFKPLVADSRDEALEMGLADTLITRLSSLKNVTVRPLSAVRRYTALDQDPVVAGRELKAQTVLESSIQKVGEKVRVTARLIHIADGKTLWTRQFDERWTDIFAVQDAISQRVADDLMAPLTGEERGELARNYTADPVAYKLYLEGRHHWSKRTAEGMGKAVESFERAIKKDPNYALAYVGLADAYATLFSYHVKPAHEAMTQAHEAAVNALKIDDHLAEAHASMGKIFTDYYWDWEQAEREFQLAIKLKPKYPNAHQWYSMVLAHMGRFDEAVSEANRAWELDYFSAPTGTQVGQILYRARRYDQAITALRKTLDLDPNFVTAHYYLGLCYLMQEKRDEALAEFKKARAIAPNVPDFIALLGYAYATAGQIDQARRCLAELNEMARGRYVPPFNYAALHVGLGETDLAFKWLEKGYDERDPWVRGLKSDPLFDVLRPDARFAKLLRRAGLAP